MNRDYLEMSCNKLTKDREKLKELCDNLRDINQSLIAKLKICTEALEMIAAQDSMAGFARAALGKLK